MKKTDINRIPSLSNEKEKRSSIEKQDLISVKPSTTLKVDKILEINNYEKIINLLSDSDEEGENSELLVNIINTYGEEGTDILFKEGGLSFLEVGTDHSIELADTDFFRDFGENILSLELRQYFCAKIAENHDLLTEERENEAYLLCCEKSNLHTGKEALLVSLLIERERSISSQLGEMGKIINSSDINALISEIYKQRIAAVGELEKSVLQLIFVESNIYTPLLNNESMRILEKVT